MEYRQPVDLPNEHQLHTPLDYKAYKPVTDPLFQKLFPSSEFPNEVFSKVENIDTNL